MAPEFNVDKFMLYLDSPSKTDAEKNQKEGMRVAYNAISIHAAKKHAESADFQYLKAVINDLHEIRERSKPAYQTLRLAITMYPSSYRKIAKIRGVSHIAVYNQLKRLSQKYSWVGSFMVVMAEY